MRTVTRIEMSRWLAAETVMLAFGSESENVVWFDAGAEADALGDSPRDGHPRRSSVAWGRRVVTGRARDPGTLADAWQVVSESVAQPRFDADPLGWWGWVGYGAGAEMLAPGDPAWARSLGDPSHPDLALMEVDRALVFDHDTGRVELVLLGDAAEHSAWLDHLTAWWDGDEIEQALPPDPPDPAVAVWADSEARYLALIDRCQEAIREGDAFVMCLATSVSVHDVHADDLEVYRRLRRASPAPGACFLRLGGVSLLSATPETFLTVDRAGVVITRPIKGTRPRGSDPIGDRALADDLASSEKERAENLMIVDLMRNDLSRVAVPGSIDVTEFFGVHTYEHVHQLVSTVTAHLRPDTTSVDVVRSTFPPGSMTGAPKHHVVEVLADGEAAPRGVYSGAVGRFGLDGALDLSVVIRSIVLDRVTRVASIGVGGGITASSNPPDEVAEIRTKAAALLGVLGVTGPEAPSMGQAIVR